MFPEVCVRGLQTMVPGLGSYLGNIPRSTIVDGGYYTETPELLPLVGPVGGEGLEGAWLCGGLAGYGVMAANVSAARSFLGSGLHSSNSRCNLRAHRALASLSRSTSSGPSCRRTRRRCCRGGTRGRSMRRRWPR